MTFRPVPTDPYLTEERVEQRSQFAAWWIDHMKRILSGERPVDSRPEDYEQ